MNMNVKEIVLLIAVVITLSLTGNKEINMRKDDDQKNNATSITLFLCGDVMTGRGVDQILPHSVDPLLYEGYVKDARSYVQLAEEKNGEIEQPVDYEYIWGDALEIWKKVDPDFRIINLETSITTHPEPWPAKGVNYRMHPENVKVLTAAGIDFCSLANNHTMDWREEGLHETTQSLNNAGIAHAGAGKTLEEARNPQILKKDYARVIILSYGSKTSGIPGSWAATHDRAGVNMLPDFSDETIEMIGNQVKSVKQEDDFVVFSIHWGGNWGYDIPVRQQEFAHQLIDKAGVDIIHGHSSHHAKGIEIYKNRLIIYGAGDFINDYEGISGHDQYRDDLTLMYFPTLDPETGKLLSLKLAPLQIKKMRLNHVSEKDRQWLFSMLNREGQELGTHVTINEDGFFSLQKAKSSIQN